MKTMAASKASVTARMMKNFTLPPVARTAAPPAGRPDTTLAKMRVDIH
jgi:hypothetical protein